MKRKSLFLLFCAIATTCFSQNAPQSPVNLRINYCIEPIGLDDLAPRFSWEISDIDRSEKQTAYELIVASSFSAINSFNGDVWTSGKVTSNKQNGVAYAGTSLTAQKQYWWRVRTYDKDNKQGAWSNANSFETGLLSNADWKAKMLAGDFNLVREEFAIPAGKTITRARAYITADSYYELRINGAKIGNHVMDPLMTETNKVVLYSTFDITANLLVGSTNAVGIMLGGFTLKKRAENVKAICQLDFWYSDGTSQTISTNNGWKTLNGGPFISQHIFHGEKYDARADQNGWDKAGFNETGWFTPDEISIGIKLKAQLNPITISEVITPVAMFNPTPGVYVYDMGKNISGWAELTVNGASGTTVTLRFAERIFPDKNINMSSTHGGFKADGIDSYTLKGSGTEVWEPRFTYHGFRYVEVTGFPGTPTISSIKGKFFHSQVTNTVSKFNCSNPDLVAISNAYKLTQLDNLMGLPTDCNQRAEREGWLADAMVTSEAAMTYFDAFAFYEKWINDMLINEKPGGRGDVCIPAGGGRNDIIWESAVVSVPWDYYNMSGDSAFLSKVYPRCKSLVEWLKGLDVNNNFIFEPKGEGAAAWRNFNDWMPVGGNRIPKPGANYISTLYYYRVVSILSDMAQVLGISADYSTYSGLATNIKSALNTNFLQTSYYDNNVQTGNALALDFGIVPSTSFNTVLDSFLTDIDHDGDTQLKTGCLGTYGLMNVLGKYGYSNVAYKLAARKTFPSWGYMLNVPDASGTLWETWNNEDLSKNHPFLSGSVATWLINYVAGIKSTKPGYSEVQLKPSVTQDLSSGSGAVYTVKGAISSSWVKTNGKLTWDVTVPANISGLLYIPTLGNQNAVKITEGKTTIWKGSIKNAVEGLQYIRTEGDFQVWSIGAGVYKLAVIPAKQK